jgi:hypothetical protein
MIKPEELRKIVRFCQKNGIIKFKSGDFEIEIKERPKAAARSKELLGTEEPTFPNWDSLTPEQKLLWSSTPDLPTTSS